MFVLNKNELPNKLTSAFPDVEQLYVEGDASVLELPSVGVIGTRKPSKETVEFINEKVDELSKEYTIVSGLALGCDKIAHEACLNSDGITIAVLPCGLDKPYPLMHKNLMKRIIDEGGCVVSEYKNGTKPNRKRFLERNRITAGLSDKLLVAECKIKSGTMNTVRHFAEIDRNIYTPANHEGSNYILRKFHNSHVL